MPKLASAPGGTDVTCTSVPGVPRTLKLGMLTLGKLKLGMLGRAPQPETAAQLSTKAIARRIIIGPRHPLRRVTYKIGDFAASVWPLRSLVHLAPQGGGLAREMESSTR